MIYMVTDSSPLGDLTMACDGKHLTGLWLKGQKYFCRTLREETRTAEDLPVFQTARNWLERYFAGARPLPSELPLAPEGSEFQRMIWELLCRIPYGGTTTYGALAAQAAALRNQKTVSPEAVGGAVGRNPISIIIPCHRVIGADGGLTGYAGGLEKKRWLLDHEGARFK